MAPTLHKLDASPPCRSVYILADALGLQLNLKDCDLFNKEHRTPEFEKLNPTHTVPVLVDDDGFALWDSHAILTYLADKYGKGTALYPTDLKKRSVINQMLHFDSSTLFIRGMVITKHAILLGETDVPAWKIEALQEAFALAETFLQDKPYIVGDEPTLADISFFTSITSFSVIEPVTDAKYPKMSAWIKRMEALPYTSANRKGLEEMHSVFRKVMGESKNRVCDLKCVRS